MNLNTIFKQTMDYMGVRGSDLAELAGCSRNNISEIRNGKVNPSIDKFWSLIEDCERLAPGFKREFGKRVAGMNMNKAFSPEELLNTLDSSQIAALTFALGRWLDHNLPKEEKDLEITYS